MKKARLAVLFAGSAAAVFGGYTYDFTDSLASYNASNWTQNGGGVLSFGSSGMTSSTANGGSLIWTGNLGVNYEVKMKLTLGGSGGTYGSYLRATGNALAGPGLTGSFYSVEVQNPTFSGGGCSATLLVSKSVSGTVTTLAQWTIPCHDGMEVRTVYAGTSGILFYLDNVWYGQWSDSSLAAGQPGIGVRGAPANNFIQSVSIGHMDTVAPSAVSAASVASSSFPTHVDLQWQPPADDANGTGITHYAIQRNGVYVDLFQQPEFSDQAVAPGTTYQYTIFAFDFHFNLSQTTITVSTPAASQVDPRRVGIRPTGAYWGGLGENIDLLSGNLNFSLPLLRAQSRGGWGASFNLTYNSENWRKDSAATWNLGRDVGHGYGWKLLAGSLTPYYSSYWNIHHYIFTTSVRLSLCDRVTTLLLSVSWMVFRVFSI